MACVMEAAMASHQSKPLLTTTTPRVSLGGRGGTGKRLYKHTGAQSKLLSWKWLDANRTNAIEPTRHHFKVFTIRREHLDENARFYLKQH